MKPERSGAPSYWGTYGEYGTVYIDKRLPMIGTANYLTTTWTLESSETAIYLQGHVAKSVNWLASLVGETETDPGSKYVLAYRYQLEREDYGDGKEGNRIESEDTTVQNASVRVWLATGHLFYCSRL